MRKLARFALTIGAAALFAGCGGSQSPIGVPSAMPQSRVDAMLASRHGSWMAPGAKKGALLYVGGLSDVYVYSYPKGKLVGTLTGFDDTSGLCSDKNGNVWITNLDNSEGHGYVVEYAHGGTSALKTLSEPYEAPQGCSVDPQTGDLAVANGGYDCCGSSLFVYPQASGTPAEYSTYGPYQPFITCTYDNAGNIYIATTEDVYDAATLWLPKGGSSLKFFPIYPKPFPHPHLGIQWDGTYLVTEARQDKIMQNVVEGSEAYRHARIEIASYPPEYLWIQGSRIIGTAYDKVVYWKYPDGGEPVKEFSAPGRVEGLTVSVAPSR